MRVGVYARVSTDEQAKEGYSIPAHLQHLKEYCRLYDWTIIDEYIDDGYSAKNLDRPQLKRLLSDVENKNIENVLIYKLDRITRSVGDLNLLINSFEKHGCKFNSFMEKLDTSSATGRFFINILGSLAQFEREQIGERVKVGMEQMAASGKRPGGPPPYGYKKDGEHMVIDKDKAYVVRTVFDWYSEGKGLHTILKRLEDMSVPSPTGNSNWHISYVRHMLRNVTYTGKIIWSHKISQGSHEAIIDEVTFRRVQDIIEERRLVPPSENKGKYPLTGVLRCGRCGSKMNGKMFHKGKSYERIYYRCALKNPGKCEMPYMRQDQVEPDIVAFADYMLKHEEELKEELDKQKHPPQVLSVDVKKLKKELTEVTRKKNEWYQMFNDPESNIPKEDLYANIKPFVNKEKELHDQLKLVEVDKETPSPEYYMELYPHFEARWNVSTPEERKRMMHDIFDYIIVNEDLTYEYKFK